MERADDGELEKITKYPLLRGNKHIGFDVAGNMCTEGDVQLFNATYHLNGLNVRITMSSDNHYLPIIVFEDRRFCGGQVVLSPDEWAEICENSLCIASMCAGGWELVSVILSNHTVVCGDYPGTIKIYKAGNATSEFINVDEDGFKSLIYSNFAIQNAIDLRVAWRDYVKQYCEIVLGNLMEISSKESKRRQQQKLTEDFIARQYDICNYAMRNKKMYDNSLPDVGAELRSHMGDYVYPYILAQLS